MDICSELKDAQLEVKSSDLTSDTDKVGKIIFSTDSDAVFVQHLTKVRQLIDGFVGDIKHSMLTEAQMQAAYGDDWVLADGGSSVGSKYETITGNSTVPDLRGMVLRGKNNSRADGNENPAGDNALGTYEDDTTRLPRNSSFTSSSDGSHRHSISGYAGSGDGYAATKTRSDNYAATSYTNYDGTHSHSITGGGDTETRMKNVTVNIFIKIN